MRIPVALVGLLALLACRDPYDFAPGDPSKPDPPAGPVPLYPPSAERIDNWGYPQDVEMGWTAVSGAAGYQVEVYTESIPEPPYRYTMVDQIVGPAVSVTFYTYGWYYWRVRAVSPNWNWYTDWSELWSFALPNPAR